MKKKKTTMRKRLPVIALALAMLPLSACGSQNATTQEAPAPAQETPAPTQEVQPEMNRDELPSDMLQGVYNELTADYSAYGEFKRYYDEYMPDVKYSEELGEDRFTVTLDSSSEYVESGSWSTRGTPLPPPLPTMITPGWGLC